MPLNPLERFVYAFLRGSTRVEQTQQHTQVLLRFGLQKSRGRSEDSVAGDGTQGDAL